MKLLFLLALAFPGIAAALDLEVGAGITNFSTLGDNFYYQEGMPHKLELNKPAFRLTASQDIAPWLTINASYLYFGRPWMSTHAAPDLDDYAPSGIGGYDPATNQCRGECGPKRDFVSTGSLQAFALTLEPNIKRGQWRFGIEAGPALFKGAWSATMTVASETSPWGERGSVERLSYNAPWTWTMLAGASVSYKDVVLRYTYIRTPSRGVTGKNIPFGAKDAHMLTLGVRF